MTNELGEHTKRLFELYYNKNNNFQKYFTILLGLSIFFIFFLILPYTIIQISLKEVSNEIDAKLSEINDINLTKRDISNAKEGLILLRSEINNGNKTFFSHIEEIRKLKKIINSIPNDIDKYKKTIESTDCLDIKEPGEQAHCTIGEQFKIQYSRVNNLLENNFNLIDPFEFKESNFPILKFKNDIESLQDQFNTTKLDDGIYSNTTMWKKVISDGVNNTNQFYNKYYAIINKEISYLENLSQNKSNEIIQLNNTLTGLRENQKEIKNRIEGFESPMGKLTIGFNDLLRIFPFALLIGFIVIISLLIESMTIRRKLMKFFSNSIEKNNALNENDIVDVAPLWIDPKNNEQNKFIRCFVLILPFILYYIFPFNSK